MEDDIINSSKTDEFGIGKDYNKRIKWLINEFRKTIDTIKDTYPQMPEKRTTQSFIWINPTRHCNYKNNQQRKKFGECLENMTKCYETTQLSIWGGNGTNIFLEQEQRYTTDGLFDFWEAIDKTIDTSKLEDWIRTRLSSSKMTGFPIIVLRTIKMKAEPTVQTAITTNQAILITVTHETETRFTTITGHLPAPPPSPPILINNCQLNLFWGIHLPLINLKLVWSQYIIILFHVLTILPNYNL